LVFQIDRRKDAIEPIPVGRSRRDVLQKKVEKKFAEEQEKERQRIEEQKKLQEKKKELAEALANCKSKKWLRDRRR
jgi:hypothetical protein